ncbi:hypothetical protein F2Q69_00046763 [Brassica cretica]|uniref:Uncharacterized protein n=1 Tax=Brassica cretica TaxID=69181 RepID=A0A8S9PQM5_BRACR|nr:hypothetical protein F2Q69_00046763 [Brassica cretica]
MTFNSLQLSSQVRWFRTVKMNAKIACASFEFVSEIADWPVVGISVACRDTSRFPWIQCCPEIVILGTVMILRLELSL